MSFLEDFVKFGGTGSEPAWYSSRCCPWIVSIANAAEKEGIFSEVIVGGIPVIGVVFPVAFSQVDCSLL